MNKNKVLISFIVPIYDVEYYLEECLDSILQQTNEKHEIICIEDCSKDKSRVILERYKKKYPELIIIQNSINKGLSYSRNIGVNKASGKYICFVDSDDYIDKNYIAVISEYLYKSEKDIFCYNYTEYDEYKKNHVEYPFLDKYVSQETLSGMDMLNNLLESNNLVIAVWNKIYRKEFLINNNLFFMEGILHEDLPFTLKAFYYAKKVQYINKALYYFRKRPNSITTMKHTIHHIEGRFLALMNILEFWNEKTRNVKEDYIIKKYIEKYNLCDLYDEYHKYECKDLKYENIIYQFFWEQLSFRSKKKVINEKILYKYKQILIYGAGIIAKRLFYDLLLYDIKILGFAVTDMSDEKFLFTHDVKRIEDYEGNTQDILVIIATSKKYENDIFNVLKKLGYENIIFNNDIYKGVTC